MTVFRSAASTDNLSQAIQPTTAKPKRVMRPLATYTGAPIPRTTPPPDAHPAVHDFWNTDTLEMLRATIAQRELELRAAYTILDMLAKEHYCRCDLLERDPVRGWFKHRPDCIITHARRVLRYG